MNIEVVETKLSDNSKVYAVHFPGVHETGAVLTVVVDCVSEAAAKTLRDNLDAAYAAVWINDRVQVRK
jgi:hypothetical protein